MIDEPTHTVKKMALCALAISIIVWKVKYSLRFVVSYVRPVTHHYMFEKHPAIHAYRIKRARPSYINYYLKSEVSITLRCQLCSTRYTAVWIKNYSKSTAAIKVPNVKNTDNFRYEGKPSRATANHHFSLSAKMNGTQRRTLVSPWRMHCMYCGMPKGTSRTEATSNSEKIKPVALAVIKLHLSAEGISQWITQSVSRKFHLILKFCSNLLKAFRVNLKTNLGLVLPNQYCLIVVREVRLVLEGFFHGPHPLLCGPYCTVLSQWKIDVIHWYTRVCITLLFLCYTHPCIT